MRIAVQWREERKKKESLILGEEDKKDISWGETVRKRQWPKWNRSSQSAGPLLTKLLGKERRPKLAHQISRLAQCQLQSMVQ